MTLLFRYLVRNNALILLPTLGVGIGMYLLTDLFERLENFIEAGVSAKMAIIYFVVKIPLVISQILPVIFLLSTVIQLCLMARNRELTALQTGGISLGVVARSMLICGLFWSCTQLAFSEYLGVAGERESLRIWQEEVHKKNLVAAVLHNQWFSNGQWIVSLGQLRPDNTGVGFSGYELSADGKHLERLVFAPNFSASPGRWVLKEASTAKPAVHMSSFDAELVLPLEQDPATFRLVQHGEKPSKLPIWLLNDAIEQLQSSGSNVEALRTALYAKLAYAASIFIMALVATAIVSWQNNIYIAVALSLVCTFLYYAIYTLGSTMGERGIVDPFLATWACNGIAFLCALWRLLYTLFAKRFQ